MLGNGNSDNGMSLLGLLIAVVIVLGLLWYVFGGASSPSTTATPDKGIEVPTTPPPTTPITPRAPE